MALNKYLKTVTNLNEYISFTSDIQNKRIDLKIPFNISTVLSLKNIRSIEIEYFYKCEENGAALQIIELLLRSPPSKTWSLLGGELISLLQYWLEALRKHLITHNIYWWTFLKSILKFIKDIRLKDVSLIKILIEETGECLLDLATHSIPEAHQRNEILNTFNILSAEASRSIRFAYREKFQCYFIKLSALLATTGDFPLQHRLLETLLRWLLPRHDISVRQLAAEKWFTEETYSRRAVGIFLERAWQDFMKDARDFLNAQNEFSGLVTSFACKTFSVGRHVCFTAKHKNECWLDLNSSTKSLSILVDPRWSDALGGDGSCDAVVVSDENIGNVELKRDRDQLLLQATVLDISRVYPFASDVIADCDCSLRFAVSTRSDMGRFDVELRAIFGGKYENCLGSTSAALNMSPDDRRSSSDVINGTEEEIRFSMPLEVRRRKHSGFALKSRRSGLLNSPSSVSTSSLAQLHEKLASLPQYTFDKEPVTVCALPQLSTVSEISEGDEIYTNNSSLSTIKYKRYGVVHKRINPESKTTHSTSEDSINKRNISPVVNDDESSISCLLVATIGSASDSIISDAIGRLPKDVPCNTDNIVDLLVKEALDTGRHDIGEGNKAPEPENCQLESPDNGKFAQFLLNAKQSQEQQPIDESSNEIVENTPVSCIELTKRKGDKKLLNTNGQGDHLIHNSETVEDFFSQHITENRNGELVISPSLARKINQTSSECSEEDFDQCIFREDIRVDYIVQDFEIVPIDDLLPDADIVECVNAMVDKVCQDLEKCSNYIHLGAELREVNTNARPKRTLRKTAIDKVVQGKDKHDSKKNVNPKSKEKENNTVKLKFPIRKSVSNKKTSRSTNRSKKEQPFTIMSPIIERDSVANDGAIQSAESVIESAKSPVITPLIRRKRKLYSPKDETCHEKKTVHVIHVEDDGSTSELKDCSKTPKSIAISYKELEQERKKPIRKLRNRLSLKRPETTVSPRTLKMNQIFDDLKEVTHGEPVTLADKTQLQSDATFNFTSDSEYGGEKVKSKTTPTPGKHDGKTVRTTRVSQKVDKKSENRTRKPRTRRTVTKKTEMKNATKIMETPKRCLEDERMREDKPAILNTSLVNDCPDPEKSSEKLPDPILNVAPQMEYIPEDNGKSENSNIKEKQSKTKKALSLKRNKNNTKSNLELNMADDGTLSPLPGLVVETVLTTEIDVNDSVTAKMFQKFKDIYQGDQAVESEVNTTHNLLSDTNDPIHSPSILNVSKENQENDTKQKYNRIPKKITKENAKRTYIRKIKTKRNSPIVQHVVRATEVIELSPSEVNCERSMATMGESPITGHGDLSENPPSQTLLEKDIPPRIVEQEYLKESIKDFFNKLTEQLNESNEKDDSVDGLENNLGRVGSIKSDTIKSPLVTITRLSPEYIRSRMSRSSSIDINSLKYSTKPSKDKSEKAEDDGDGEPPKTKIRSTISPIKLSADFKLINSSPPESDDNCLKRVKSIFANKKQPTIQSNGKTNRTQLLRTLKNTSGSAADKPDESISSTASSKASKRKHSSTAGTSKRSKCDEVNIFGHITESGPSASSVDEWFRRNEPTNKAANKKLAIEENLKNVLEKLDTSLVEIHHNTNKRFVNMFVEATTQLDSLKQRRQLELRRTAADIMSSVVKVIDEKFLDLDNRLQSMNDQFMESLKKQAHDLIREECKQKSAMVTMLREDVQSVLDHLEKTKTSY